MEDGLNRIEEAVDKQSAKLGQLAAEMIELLSEASPEEGSDQRSVTLSQAEWAMVLLTLSRPGELGLGNSKLIDSIRRQARDEKII